MNNQFLLFYSPKPRRQARILIHRKWSIKITLPSLIRGRISNEFGKLIFRDLKFKGFLLNRKLQTSASSTIRSLPNIHNPGLRLN